eukprot:5295845-Prymnesium_polylepis.1
MCANAPPARQDAWIGRAANATRSAVQQLSKHQTRPAVFTPDRQAVSQRRVAFANAQRECLQTHPRRVCKRA